MWKDIINEYAQRYNTITIRQGATPDEIKQVEDTLHIELPEELISLLSELNGDGDLLMSTQEIIETNKDLWSRDFFMPLDCLLFFGRNGCGDYYGYPILKNGELKNDVFMWDHDYDNRTWVANNLAEVIRRRYSDEI